MSLSKFNPRTAVLLIMIIIVGAIRFVFLYNKQISPLSNFSPLGAMALFGGAYFSKNWKAFGFPLLTLFISDVVLSFTVFNEFRSGLLYGGWYWTYGAFALMTLASKWMARKVTVTSVLTSALVIVLIHWIVSDFGVWISSALYPQTFEGFIACLIAAIPYELNLLAGTILYSAILFGCFEWMQKKHSVLQLHKAEY
jgi:hypothetical protein